MRVLWIVNNLIPQASEAIGKSNSSSGTWLFEWSRRLVDAGVNLAIACVYGSEFRSFSNKGITFYLLPGNGKNMLFYTKKYEKLWKKIVSDFKPDLIHLQGTEYNHGLACMRSLPNEKYVVSIQSFISKIKKVDFGGIDKKTILFNRTFKENFHLNGIFENHLIHNKNSRSEKEIMRRAQFAHIVNDWEEASLKFINPNIKVYRYDYELNDVFKNGTTWSFDKCIKHQIFTNPGGTPLKGVHQLIKAVAILKNKYNDIQLIVPGMGDGKHLIVKNGYSKIISKLIKKNNLEDNIHFLGYQTSSQMKEQMLACNVFVAPSALEGAPLMLREAMVTGCVCISSFRGGMQNYITSGLEGFCYDFTEFEYLSYLIDKVFSMPKQEIMKLSDAAIEKTKYFYNDDSFHKMLTMYREIAGKDK